MIKIEQRVNNDNNLNTDRVIVVSIQKWYAWCAIVLLGQWSSRQMKGTEAADFLR
jgi:hypothetical protein